MALAETSERTTTDIAIFTRILGGSRLTPPLARHLLKLGFSPDDKARMHDLALRNQSGSLTSAERAELQSYASVGCMLGILHSKARQTLKRLARN